MTAGPFESQNGISDGSPGEGEPFFLAVGQLRRPHGVRGEMTMVLYTEFPERLQPGKQVFIGERHKPVKISRQRWHRDMLLIAFDEYPDRNSIEVLRNQTVYVSVDQLPELPEGEFYQYELVDLQVFTEEGEHIGNVVEILETGANDVLILETDGEQEILLPYIDEVVREIDLDRGIITVHLLPGLLESQGKT
ncbi:MAG: ribosome maturation factor RimM [Anaerolineales bacterium]